MGEPPPQRHRKFSDVRIAITSYTIGTCSRGVCCKSRGSTTWYTSSCSLHKLYEGSLGLPLITQAWKYMVSRRHAGSTIRIRPDGNTRHSRDTFRSWPPSACWQMVIEGHPTPSRRVGPARRNNAPFSLFVYFPSTSALHVRIEARGPLFQRIPLS